MIKFMTLTRYGWREWGSALLIAIILWLGCYYLGDVGCWDWAIVLAILVFLGFAAVAFFFRSPYRDWEIPEDPELILSPADGTVRDVEVVDFAQEPFFGQARRVGIFLSIFNVHVNRAPTDWKVISKIYREGHHVDARDPNCARENEAMTLAGTAKIDANEFPMGVRQISGAIARHIVCPVEMGNSLTKGEIYGMIKFGSRTELYLPNDDRFEILVKPGDKVCAGITALARFHAAPASESKPESQPESKPESQPESESDHE